jgi:hypothetical protein
MCDFCLHDFPGDPGSLRIDVLPAWDSRGPRPDGRVKVAEYGGIPPPWRNPATLAYSG